MKENAGTQKFVQIILRLADDVVAAKDQLTELDATIGDGDLGVTMTLGFNAVKEDLASAHPSNPQEVLRIAGKAFADKAASTFGTLMAAMFMRAGEAVKGKECIGAAEFASMLRAAAEGVQKRGKAKLGEKTVLDALFPAVEAAERASASGQGLSQCVDEALAGARQGAEDAVKMRSQAGRASWFGDRTIGVKDPGAAALVIMLDSIAKSVRTIVV
jgi:phosphoenolpyruvate---glycerone phosphotransferase subunit DhaL